MPDRKNDRSSMHFDIPSPWERFKTRALRVLKAKRTTHAAYTRYLFTHRRYPVELLEDTGTLPPEACARITQYFAAAKSAEQLRTPSMWDAHEQGRAALLTPIADGDVQAMNGQFQRLFRTNAVDGMSHGNSLFTDPKRNPYERGFFERRTLDCLLSLAEATGVAGLPSHGQWRPEDNARYLELDQSGLVGLAQDALGFDLTMPDIGGPSVIQMAGQPVAPDVLRHAYVAWRVRQLMDPSAPVLEIGGGYGMLGLLAHRAGMQNWTILDLPFVGCIQMAYLMRALGPDNVASTEEETTAPMTIAKPEDIQKVPDNGLGMVVNCDSLPEMGRETALSYLKEIHRVSPRFLSINQEAGRPFQNVPQSVVKDLIKEVGGFRRIYRFRYWMEQGYTEELYERV